MLRQSTYSTARFGLYNYFAKAARQRTGQQRLSSSWEVACAALAGGMAGVVGNPTEVRPFHVHTDERSTDNSGRSLW